MAYKKFTASEDMLKPDPRFNSKLVSKFINCLMYDGKKTIAQKVFYGAMDQVAKKMKDKGFARQVPRDQLTRGAEELGIPFEEHVENVIAGLRTIRGELGL